MIDTLIVARDNKYGLTRDAAILAGALGEAGIAVATAGARDLGWIDWLLGRRKARRIVHLERIFPRWIGAAEMNVVIPNQERFPQRHVGRLRRVDAVFAKTLEGATAFAGQGAPVEYLGFTSEDRFDASVAKDWNRVLHLAGGSTLKGTEDVLALWDRHPEWPELVLVQKKANAPRRVPDNVRLIADYVDDAELRRLQNQCAIHLCPSRAEGWGHHIVEAMSCGALVITTDAPPMSEHIRSEYGMLVETGRSERRHLGTNHFVALQALESAIARAIALPWSKKVGMGELARRRFLAIDAAFRQRVRALFAAGQRDS